MRKALLPAALAASAAALAFPARKPPLPADARPWMNPAAFSRPARRSGARPDDPRGEADPRLRLFRHRFPAPQLHRARRRPRRARPAMSPASRGSAFRRNGRPTPASASPPRAARRTSASAPPSPPAWRSPPPGTPDIAFRGRRDDRRGGARVGLQRDARRRRRPGARAAQRPQFRIWRRGPPARRHDGRRTRSPASSPTTSSRRSSIMR